MVAEKAALQRLMFVDDMGANTSFAPLYSYTPKFRGRTLRSIATKITMKRAVSL